MKFKKCYFFLAYLLCAFFFSPDLPAQVPEFSRGITQPSDDAGFLPFNCQFVTDDNEIYFGECYNGNEIVSGFRFQNIDVAAPADIAEAHLEFWVDGTYDNNLTVRFFGEAADSSATFSLDNAITDRALTGNYSDWIMDSTDVWIWDTGRRGPDVTELLREIVGRPGWQSGNPVSFIVYNVVADSNHRRVFAYERLGDGTKTAKLVVNSVIPEEDISVSFITRLPRMDYVWDSTNPAIEGWPAVNDTITWQAVVKNWSNNIYRNVHFAWYLDDQLIAADSTDLNRLDTTGVSLPRVWNFDRHRLRFEIDDANGIAETEEQNNSLEIFTDAISTGFYVEQDVYDYFHQYQRELGVGTNCWEDWAQLQVSIWNQMFASAIYPDSPDGVLDRIRIDNITVVDNGALPLAGGLPTNNPNLNDRTIDLQWGFPATLLEGSFYSNHTDTTLENPFYFEGSLIHELGHARYLIDVYGFNVHDDGSGNTMAIEENGTPILDSEYMPFIIWDVLHYTAFEGLMAGPYTFVDEYSVIPLNMIAGHRATRGNFNAPENIGVFLQDLPLENRLVIKDQSGALLPQADVKIFRAGPQEGVWYGKYYDNIPDIALTADANGAVLLGRCPFSENGIIEHGYGIANGVAVVRVASGQRVGYAFLESTYFNMEYWRGNTAMGNYELSVNMIDPTEISESLSVPKEFSLKQNYPNPFNPETQINFELPRASEVRIAVYDIGGREIRELLNDKMNAGFQSISFDAKELASGVYFYELTAGSFRQVRKMILMK